MLRKSNMVFGRFLIPELLSQFIADQAVLVGYSSLSAQIYLEWLRARERGRKYALSTAQFDDAVIEKFRQWYALIILIWPADVRCCEWECRRGWSPSAARPPSSPWKEGQVDREQPEGEVFVWSNDFKKMIVQEANKRRRWWPSNISWSAGNCVERHSFKRKGGSDKVLDIPLAFPFRERKKTEMDSTDGSIDYENESDDSETPGGRQIMQTIPLRGTCLKDYSSDRTWVYGCCSRTSNRVGRRVLYAPKFLGVQSTCRSKGKANKIKHAQ